MNSQMILDEFKEKSKNERDYFRRYGITFRTKNKKYFYDSGTQKVFQCEDDELFVIESLLKGNLENVSNMLKNEKESTTVEDVLTLIDEENLFRLPEFNEFVYPNLEELPELIEGNIEQFIFELTEKCNLRCKYCSYNEYNPNVRGFGSKDLTFEIAKKVLDSNLKSYKNKEKPSITFYGGEPLIRFDLMKKIINYAEELIGKGNFSVSFTTNLTLLTDEMISYFNSLEELYILCSIDGPKEIHDRYRKTTNGDGTHGIVIENFLKLVAGMKLSSKKSMGINAVLTPPETEEKFENISNFFRDLNIPNEIKVDITYVNAREMVFDFSEDEIRAINSMTSIDPILDWAKKNIVNNDERHYKISLDNISADIRKIHQRRVTKTPDEFIFLNGNCLPGQRRLYITTNGDYQVCERMSRSYLIGNSNKNIDYDSIYLKYLKGYAERSKEDCFNCWASKICGICYASCMGEKGLDISKKKSVCSTEKKLICKSLEVYHEILEEMPLFLNNIIE